MSAKPFETHIISAILYNLTSVIFASVDKFNNITAI